MARLPKYYPPTSSHLPPLAGKKWLEVLTKQSNLMGLKNLFEAAIFLWASLYVREIEIDRLHTCIYTSMCIYSVYVYTYVYIV